MKENLGTLVSKFVLERVDSPSPDEIEIWSQLVYTALFSSGFVVWLPIAKKCSSENTITNELNILIGEIAKDANVWINSKIREALKISDFKIMTDLVPEIKFHLKAMFTEAIGVIAERKYTLELARSHSCFVHLKANLEQIAMTAKIPINIQHVLKQGLAGCDSMAEEIQVALKSK